MKSHIAMLFVSASLLTGCYPKEIVAVPPEAPACQRPKGTYAVLSKVTSVADDPDRCAAYAVGLTEVSNMTFDENGNFGSCTTTYANNDCEVKVDCAVAGNDHGLRYTAALDLNPEGTHFTGSAERANPGYMCPRVTYVLVGIR